MNVTYLPIVLLDGMVAAPSACELRARACGLDVELHITQTVRNIALAPAELVVHVPITATAGVRRVEVTFGEATIVATLEDVLQARAAYDMAIAARRRAALAVDRGGDAIVLIFGNIGAGESASCVVVMDDSLAVESRPDGKLAATLRLPTAIPPRYGAVDGPTNAALRFAARFTALPAASRTSLHEGPVEQDRDLVASCAAGADVWFEFELDDAAVVGSALLTPDAPLGRAALPGDALLPHDATLAVTVRAAHDRTRAPIELVVVLDRSGSMGGWKQAIANDLAADLVERLTDADHVAAFAFDNVCERVASGDDGAVVTPAPATYGHRHALSRALRRVAPRGGTELAGALEGVAGALGPARTRRVTIVLTDGQLDDDAGVVLRATAAQLGEVRVVAIGEGAHHGLLTRLGHCERVSSPDELLAAADRLRSLVRAAAIAAVRLDVVAIDGTEHRLECLVSNPLVAGSCATVYARCPSSSLARTLVLVRPDGSEERVALARRRCEPAATARGRYARLAVRDAENLVARGALDRADLVRLSLAASVLCSQTAFVAIGGELPAVDADPVGNWFDSSVRYRRSNAPDAGPGTVRRRVLARRSEPVSTSTSALPPLVPSAGWATSGDDVYEAIRTLTLLVNDLLLLTKTDPMQATRRAAAELERLSCLLQPNESVLATMLTRLSTLLRSGAAPTDVNDALVAVYRRVMAGPWPSLRS